MKKNKQKKNGKDEPSFQELEKDTNFDIEKIGEYLYGKTHFIRGKTLHFYKKT